VHASDPRPVKIIVAAHYELRIPFVFRHLNAHCYTPLAQQQWCSFDPDCISELLRADCSLYPEVMHSQPQERAPIRIVDTYELIATNVSISPGEQEMPPSDQDASKMLQCCQTPNLRYSASYRYRCALRTKSRALRHPYTPSCSNYFPKHTI
jgi:hypothetical protein